jgi:hypothetical protein
MNNPSRPDAPVDRAAARRNYLIFTVASSIGVTVLTAVVIWLLV